MKEGLNFEECNEMEDIIAEGLEDINKKCQILFPKDDAPKFFVFALLEMAIFCAYDCSPTSSDMVISKIIRRTKERLEEEKENEL